MAGETGVNTNQEQQPAEAELELLRARHQVRPLSDPEEGFGIDRLPNGVYGFTYAPDKPSAPLFRNNPYHSFEMHKLPDGAAFIVGFVSLETAEKIDAGKEALHIDLFPEPQEGAQTLAAVPCSRVTHHRELSIREGKLDLELGPLQ